MTYITYRDFNRTAQEDNENNFSPVSPQGEVFGSRVEDSVGARSLNEQGGGLL